MSVCIWGEAGANVSLPLLTISHAADAKSIGDLGLVYQRLPDPCMCRVLSLGVFGLVYQLLPVSGSEFGPVARGLYQTLPPRRHRLTIGVGLYKIYKGLVITHYNTGEPWTHSERAGTVGQVSKRKFSERPVGL